MNESTTVIVSRNDLLLALRQTAPARQTSAKNCVPIFTYYVFIVEDGNFYVWTSDGYSVIIRKRIRAEITANTKEQQLFPIYGNMLTKMLRLLDNEPIRMTFYHSQMEVTHQYGKFYLPFENDNGVKTIIKGNESAKQTIKIEIPDFRKNLDKVAFCMGNDALRPVMNGIFFDFRDDHLVLAASNGHILAKIDAWSVAVDFTDSFIMCSKAVRILSHILPKAGFLELSVFDRQVRIDVSTENDEQLTLLTTTIDGRYPNYMSVIPQQDVFHITVNRRKFLAAIHRADIFSNDSSRLLKLRLKQDDSTITIQASDKDFEIGAYETLSAVFNGLPSGDMIIGLRANFIEPTIRHLKTDNIIINGKDNHSAITIVPDIQDDDEILYLLMPILLSDE